MIASLSFFFFGRKIKQAIKIPDQGIAHPCSNLKPLHTRDFLKPPTPTLSYPAKENTREKISKCKDFVKRMGNWPCWVQIWPYFRAEVSSFNVVSGSFCHKLWNCFRGSHGLLKSFESVGLPVLVIHSYSTMTQPCITRSLIFGVVSMKFVSIANFSVLLMTTTCFKVHDKYSQKWPWTKRL